MRTTIPVMTPLSTTTFTHDAVGSFLRFTATGAGGPARPAPVDAAADGHRRLRRASLRCAARPDLRMEAAKADVVKASRHPRFQPAGVENYLLPGSTQRAITIG